MSILTNSVVVVIMIVYMACNPLMLQMFNRLHTITIIGNGGKIVSPPLMKCHTTSDCGYGAGIWALYS